MVLLQSQHALVVQTIEGLDVQCNLKMRTPLGPVKSVLIIKVYLLNSVCTCQSSITIPKLWYDFLRIPLST